MAFMTRKEEARAALDHALTTIGVAADLIRTQEVVLNQFMAESARMNSVGPILDPTLFNSSERRATETIVKPFFEMGLTFLNSHEAAMERAREALAKVRR